MSKHLVRLVAAVGLAGAMLGTAAAAPNQRANCTGEFVQNLSTFGPGTVAEGFTRFAQTGGPGGSVVGEESRTNCGERER